MAKPGPLLNQEQQTKIRIRAKQILRIALFDLDSINIFIFAELFLASKINGEPVMKNIRSYLNTTLVKEFGGESRHYVKELLQNMQSLMPATDIYQFLDEISVDYIAPPPTCLYGFDHSKNQQNKQFDLRAYTAADSNADKVKVRIGYYGN